MKVLSLRRPFPLIRFAPSTSKQVGLGALATWLDRQRQRIHLSRLDQRLLADIGVSRDDAERESRRWT